MSEEGGITTFCIEYAKVDKADCTQCGKVIPRHSLRTGEIFRKSKSEKKKSAKHSWYHFRCWKVPELIVKLPIEQFRGYPALKEKDQKKVQRVIEKGVGAVWSDVSEKPLPPKDQTEIDDDDAALEPVPKKQKEEAEKNKKTTPKKRKQDHDDLTAQLTGVQQPPPSSKKSKKGGKHAASSSSSSSSKNDTKQLEEVITLAKDDQLELESIAKEIQKLTKKKK
ncbi:hypothetical protein BDB00DRAFT_832326 [Zychaea mexicana]|uniref:uncharacterized protein n=1 Tax=Zychaea mexicana TaxID=64656 RepID=UPI0022FE8D98|nr:uncharacterized protein BDB00DRAFT_832326 [Zychaea mexicana]KAI9491468.1 hypothetical protein BDB00DRAFT_832326 [Zychaea mexicana]